MKQALNLLDYPENLLYEIAVDVGKLDVCGENYVGIFT